MPADQWSHAFGNRLNELLGRRNVSGKELADAVGVHVNTIARWRRGRHTSKITPGLLVDLSRCLAISPAVWFLESGAPTGLDAKLRRLTDYMCGLNNDELDHFLSLVQRIIDFAERHIGNVEGDAEQ